MLEDFNVGEQVEVRYVSERSGGEVSRTGTVRQVPTSDGKRGFFIQTDDEQLTGVLAERVYSLSIGDTDGERTIQRKTYLGELTEVTPA
jgi:hypothetical protein